jgi:ribosomal protein S18 acetylase RimI-like enzyme
MAIPGEFSCQDNTLVVGYKEHFRDALVNLAGNAFIFSRFYNDFRIPLPLINRLYSALVEEKLSSCREFIKIAVIKENLAGFVVGEIDDDCPELGYLWLIAVDERFRGSGIGRELFKNFLNDIGKSVKWIEIGTQCNNRVAISLYEKFNFRMQTSLFTMHWLRGGNVAI